MPTDSVRANKVPLIRRMYGVRMPDGTVNGNFNPRFILSDFLKIVLALMLGGLYAGGCNAYKWYIKYQDVPQAFATHCEKQTQTDKELAEQMGQILEGIKTLQRNDREFRRPIARPYDR